MDNGEGKMQAEETKRVVADVCNAKSGTRRMSFNGYTKEMVKMFNSLYLSTQKCVQYNGYSKRLKDHGEFAIDNPWYAN